MPDEQLQTRIIEARRGAGLTQDEAAHRIGVAPRTYQRWEGGDTLGFFRHLERIAGAFETTPEALLADGRGQSAEIAELRDQLAELTARTTQLAELLLDPTRLRAAADELLREEPPADDDQ